MALPFFMTMIVFFIYHYIGLRFQGVGGYFKSMLFPPGVPKFLYVLVTPIEFITFFFTRPLSLAVRLFANMLAGHLLILMSVSLIIIIGHWYIGFITVPVGVFFYIFEVLLVANLQAFIFAILSGIYIGFAVEPPH
jgi:F-type H+-transporting ATPase subunit a